MNKNTLLLSIIVLASSALISCGEDSATPPPVETFKVSVEVTGLVDSITVRNNGGDDLEVPVDGTYTFETEIADGEDYEVTPLHLNSQVCTFTNSTGTIDGDDVVVPISCS